MSQTEQITSPSRPSPRLRPRRPSLMVRGALVALGLTLAVPAAAQFGKNKIQYVDFDWQIYHSPHFDVYYYSAEEQLLQEVVSLAESAYDHLSRRFDYQIEESTPLIFYKTHSEFEQNNIIQGFIPEGVGAFATNVRFRMVLPVDLPDAELYQLILHELTHIFQYHILYGGKQSGGFTTRAPTWLIEGMASYYAQDESTSDKMFLRDAVVNDLVPPITQAQGGGFFAYRFGHAVFDFMEERWGPEGVLDFLFEFRASLGSQVDRALKRAFRIEAEDFDADFRRWLRSKYLPQLVETGEPSYFGRRFFDREGRSGQYFSPAVSPSGDLVAALGSPEGDLDVILFDTQQRRPIRNLTKGFANEYQYLSTQFASTARRMGRDLSFSPDGDLIAVFGKREAGRALFLVDVLKGGIRRMIDVDVQQPFAPAFHPDGRKIAFAGSYEGQFDIFLIDLETLEVRNLTNDARFDGGPIFGPDGRYLFYTGEVGEHEKLFRLDLDSQERLAVVKGEWNDKDPWVSKDGERVFFSSDRNGFDNVYSADLESGRVFQHTNAVSGCFMPALIERADGSEALIYNGYWKGQFDIYRGDLEQLAAPVEMEEPEEPFDEQQVFEPDIQVAINDDNKEKYGGFKLFLEDGDGGIGVTSDQLIVSQAYLSFSDYLGDRRLLLLFNSVSSFSDFNFIYIDQQDRLQWGVEVYDTRTFYLGFNQIGVDRFEIERQRAAYTLTGARGFLIYPFDLYHRVEASLSANLREYDFQSFFRDPVTGQPIPVIVPRDDNYPEVRLSLVGDTAVFASFGPVSGRRWRLSGSYAPDLEESGTLTANTAVDFRQYVPLTRRMQLAFRTFGFYSSGNFPDVAAIGGLDDLRGFEFRELAGDRVFHINLELRFPLLDALRFPFLQFSGVRGRIFLDVGGAWFDYAGQEFDFWDSENNRLQDAVSAYGWGFTVRFLGLDLHWDFAKRWDFESTLEDGFETSFWIGSRF